MSVSAKASIEIKITEQADTTTLTLGIELSKPVEDVDKIPEAIAAVLAAKLGKVAAGSLAKSKEIEQLKQQLVVAKMATSVAQAKADAPKAVEPAAVATVTEDPPKKSKRWRSSED